MGRDFFGTSNYLIVILWRLSFRLNGTHPLHTKAAKPGLKPQKNSSPETEYLPHPVSHHLHYYHLDYYHKVKSDTRQECTSPKIPDVYPVSYSSPSTRIIFFGADSMSKKGQLAHVNYHFLRKVIFTDN